MPLTKKRILITGGAGFIGHHLVEHLLKNTNWEIVIIDRLSYASSGFDRLRDIEVFDASRDRVKVFTADFTNHIPPGLAQEIGQVDYIVHMGAETHVDNSIDDPESFVRANVLGTLHMLQFARQQKELLGFVYFSTDEVFGPAPEGVAYKEDDRYCSGNPYAAAKAGGEELAIAFANTYKFPVIVTHTMNAFGERQHPEKFIPSTIRKVLAGEPVIIHADRSLEKSGTRYYIHCRNIAAALLHVLRNAVISIEGQHPYAEKWNIVGEREVSNLEMAEFIAAYLGKPLIHTMTDFHSSRPGHDLRYALDGTKLRESGFEMPASFEESLKRTIEWTISNPKWLGIDGPAKVEKQ